MDTIARLIGSIFQFTPLREGRRTDFQYRFFLPQFQFTPLREGRQFGRECCPALCYFNSRPCVRGDELMDEIEFTRTISIHAPA